MRLLDRLSVARKITQEQIREGSYLWEPSTRLGWLLRIAITDVGQGAWTRAKEEYPTSKSPRAVVIPHLDSDLMMTGEMDLEPVRDPSAE